MTVNQIPRTTITLSGTFNVGDVLTLQNFSPAPDHFFSYEVVAGDNLNSIATAFAAAINGNDAMTAGAVGAVITTDQPANFTSSYNSYASYQADTITDFATGTDVLQLSAASLNSLLNTNPAGPAANHIAASGSNVYYVNSDDGTAISFASFIGGDVAASGLTGSFVYDSATGTLYLDQSGDSAWITGARVDAAGDDIAIAIVGTIVGADIHIVA